MSVENNSSESDDGAPAIMSFKTAKSAAYKSAKKQKKKKTAKQRRSTQGYTDDQLDTAEMEGGEDFQMGRSKSEVPREYRGTALEDAWLDGWNTMKRSR